MSQTIKRKSPTARKTAAAQAKARKLDPHLIVVKHPVGGLNATELEERIETAFAGRLKEMDG